MGYVSDFSFVFFLPSISNRIVGLLTCLNPTRWMLKKSPNVEISERDNESLISVYFIVKHANSQTFYILQTVQHLTRWKKNIELLCCECIASVKNH